MPADSPGGKNYLLLPSRVINDGTFKAQMSTNCLGKSPGQLEAIDLLEISIWRFRRKAETQIVSIVSGIIARWRRMINVDHTHSVEPLGILPGQCAGRQIEICVHSC